MCSSLTACNSKRHVLGSSFYFEIILARNKINKRFSKDLAEGITRNIQGIHVFGNQEVRIMTGFSVYCLIELMNENNNDYFFKLDTIV